MTDRPFYVPIAFESVELSGLECAGVSALVHVDGVLERLRAPSEIRYCLYLRQLSTVYSEEGSDNAHAHVHLREPEGIALEHFDSPEDVLLRIPVRRGMTITALIENVARARLIMRLAALIVPTCSARHEDCLEHPAVGIACEREALVRGLRNLAPFTDADREVRGYRVPHGDRDRDR